MKIEHPSQLHELYGSPSERAQKKQLSALDSHAINFITKSPFLILATSNIEGKMDASPRGGASGFVKVIHTKELMIPDAKGNNRVDSLFNIVDSGRVGILFLIPGVDETLRINGSAYITTNLEDLNLFQDMRIKSCIVVKVEEVFLHCAKAVMRSKLWDNESKIARHELPTMGQMLNDQLNSQEPIETHEAMVERYKKDL